MMHPSRSGSGLPDSEARVANSVMERISDSKVSEMSNLERDATAKRVHHVALEAQHFRAF